jgi:hypothetical protein
MNSRSGVVARTVMSRIFDPRRLTGRFVLDNPINDLRLPNWPWRKHTCTARRWPCFGEPVLLMPVIESETPLDTLYHESFEVTVCLVDGKMIGHRFTDFERLVHDSLT